MPDVLVTKLTPAQVMLPSEGIVVALIVGLTEGLAVREALLPTRAGSAVFAGLRLVPIRGRRGSRITGSRT